MQQGLAAADLEVIERTAHTLKGELVYLGLTETAEKAKALEGQGREGNLQTAAALFPEFKAQLLMVAAAMREDQPGPVSTETLQSVHGQTPPQAGLWSNRLRLLVRVSSRLGNNNFDCRRHAALTPGNIDCRRRVVIGAAIGHSGVRIQG
jgi:HPt (histidine-containing phosphotransfer) domain-containing protein